MNIDNEDRQLDGNRQPGARSSFAEAFYNAGNGFDYQYEDPLIQENHHSNFPVQAQPAN